MAPSLCCTVALVRSAVNRKVRGSIPRRGEFLIGVIHLKIIMLTKQKNLQKIDFNLLTLLKV